jgi:MFS family permease
MWTLYGNITVFYPPHVKDTFDGHITTLLVGIVLAMFELSVLISSPVVSLLL